MEGHSILTTNTLKCMFHFDACFSFLKFLNRLGRVGVLRKEECIHQENVSFTFLYFLYFLYFSQVKKVQKPESTEYLPQEILFTLFLTFCTLISAF